jgi:hypothetical protein
MERGEREREREENLACPAVALTCNRVAIDAV